jgi:hypothetical protein
MSNIFINQIAGTTDFAIPASDAALATATSSLDALLSTVSGLAYDRVLAWVETRGGAGAPRTLSCVIEKFTFNGEICPSASELYDGAGNGLTELIAAALVGNHGGAGNITSIGDQDVSLVETTAEFYWQRDIAGGFLYPTTQTDDVAVGGSTPAGKWFQDGDLVLGAAAMSGTEKLRVVGSQRLDGGMLMPEAGAVPGGNPGAGASVFWVKDDAPNIPQFTDDTNTTYTLAYAASSGFSLPDIDQVIFVDRATKPYAGVGTIQGPFNTINEAVAAATALSPGASNRIGIVVYPGIYDEPVVTVDDYVSFIGYDRNSTIIRRSEGSSDVININNENVRFENITFDSVGTHTGDVAVVDTSLTDPTTFVNCAFRVKDNNSSGRCFHVSQTCSLEFYDCDFTNIDTTLLTFSATAGSGSVLFEDCSFEGYVRLSGSQSVTFSDGRLTSSNTSQTVYADCGSSIVQFVHCDLKNTSSSGYCVAAQSTVSGWDFIGCSMSGGSSSYDIGGAANTITCSVEHCTMQRGMNGNCITLSPTKYVGSANDSDFYKTLQDAIDSIVTATPSVIVLLNDLTLSSGLTTGSSQNVIIDGQSRQFTIDRATGTLLTITDASTFEIRDCVAKGQVVVQGNESVFVVNGTYMEGQIRLELGDDEGVVLRMHDSAIIGNATYGVPLFLSRDDGIAGALYIDKSYVSGAAGSAALEYDVYSGVTIDFDSVYLQYTKMFHGDLGNNNPFTGQGTGGSAPVNDYYAHDCCFNIEPDVADSTYLLNKIDSAQRFNTIDADAAFTWMQDN